MNQLYAVFKCDHDGGGFIGVFDSKERAIAACIDARFMVLPVDVNRVYQQTDAEAACVIRPHGMPVKAVPVFA